MKPPAHPKRRGEWVELKFMTRTAEIGINVSKPWGDCLRYDFIVEHGGRLLRVQVKSTLNRHGRSYLCHCDKATKSTRRYELGDFDFFAIYIIPEDVWYIVPAAVVMRLKHFICLSPHLPTSKYEPYREAWHLLKHSPAPDDLPICWSRKH